MNPRLKPAALTISAAVALVAVTGCSSNVKTPPDQVALHYEGGITSGARYKDCVPTSTYRSDGMNDTHYFYPTNRRTYDANPAEGSESGPVTVVSKDNAEMAIPAQVTFTLDTSCDPDGGPLRAFHERMGLRYSAYFNTSDGDDGGLNPDGPVGWVRVLNDVIGKSLDITLDRQAQNYQWRAIWNDPSTKTELEKAVQSALSTEVNRAAGGTFFKIETVRLAKPTPVNQALKDAVATEQSAVAKAKSAELQAQAAEAAAKAQVAVAVAEARSLQERIKVIGIEAWREEQRLAVQRQAIEKGLNPFPSPIVAGVPAPAQKP